VRGFRLLCVLLASALTLGSSAVVTAQEASGERTLSSAHFTITWNDEGRDAPDPTDVDGDGVPDGVQRLLTAFEEARAFLLALGWREPPGDEGYPLYVSGGEQRGSTQELPGGTGRSKPSFIVVPPRFVDASLSLDRMKVFAVHEYHHAIQIGYDSDEAFWIGEATSTWLEDLFVDELDPNHYLLGSFLASPERSLLEADGAHEYGSFLFLQFLVERYDDGDPGIVRELWEEMAVPEAFAGAGDRQVVEALRVLLERRGVGLADAWGEYLLWQRRLTHFEEGIPYRSAAGEVLPLQSDRRVRRESCRIDVDGGARPFAGEYARFAPHPRSARSLAVLTVQGPPGTAGYYAVKPLGAPASEHRFSFDENGLSQASIPFSPGSIAAVTVGVGHTAERPAPLAYSLRVEGARATTADLSGSTSTTYFTPVGVTGHVVCGGEPASFARVVLTATETSSGEVSAIATTTDDDGFLRVSVRPEVKTAYLLSVVDPLLGPASSAEHLVSVRVLTTIEVPDGPVEGPSALISGTVSPLHPGAVVEMQFRRPEGEWRQGPETTVGSDGRYSVEVAFPAEGVWQVRAVALPGDDNHSPGTSVTRAVRLR
jgi:hypothetical protein